MTPELTTIIGFGFTIFSLIGALIQRDRALMRQIADDKEKMNGEIAKIRETFLLRQEFLAYIEKSEKMLDKQFERLNGRLDKLIEQRERV
jgi:hypothetical protein